MGVTASAVDYARDFAPVPVAKLESAVSVLKEEKAALLKDGAQSYGQVKAVQMKEFAMTNLSSVDKVFALLHTITNNRFNNSSVEVVVEEEAQGTATTTAVEQESATVAAEI